MKTLLVVLAAIVVSAGLVAQDRELPAPRKTGGMPLMEALSKRATARAFHTRDLSPQQLADLLWAGFGVNRPDGRRTAPSANNAQEHELYVLLKQGVFVYDAPNHRLRLVASEDLRSLGGKPEAPVTVLFVADLTKRRGTPEQARRMAEIDAGFIGENIYLFCASEGLATGYRGSVDRENLVPKLNLRPGQELIAAQSVGFPKP